MFAKPFTAAALLALPFVVQSVSAKACTRQYTIQAGDICDSISAAKNVSTYQLATVNHGIIDSACSNLQIGAKICLGYEGEDCSTTYVVKPNDVCDQISAAHGINNTILYLNNPQIDEGCSNIYVGEVLCVGGTVQCPPPPAGAGKGQLPAATIPATATPANPKPTPKSNNNNAGTPPPPQSNNNTPPPPPKAPTPPKAPSAPTKAPSTPPAPTEVDDGADDENLPYCDEL